VTLSTPRPESVSDVASALPPLAFASIDVAPESPVDATDPAATILTCANCGARMIERKC
jgi:hypothetical protein